MEQWNHTKLHSRSTSSYLLPMNVRGSQSLDISISSSEDANNTNSLTRFLYYVSLYVKHLENSKISISGSYWPLTKNIILRNRNWSKIGHKYQLLSLGAEFLKLTAPRLLLSLEHGLSVQVPHEGVPCVGMLYLTEWKHQVMFKTSHDWPRGSFSQKVSKVLNWMSSQILIARIHNMALKLSTSLIKL